MRNRNHRGQFINKSNSDRRVRSIRVTDEIWEKFGEVAVKRCITRADLLEEIVEDNYISVDLNRIIVLLKKALKLKANAGGGN